MARRKWNGSGEMKGVNEMYLGLNTLRDRFGIGPMIKNHSEGELMQRDRPDPKTPSALWFTTIHPEAFKGTNLQLNTHSNGV